MAFFPLPLKMRVKEDSQNSILYFLNYRLRYHATVSAAEFRVVGISEALALGKNAVTLPLSYSKKSQKESFAR